MGNHVHPTNTPLVPAFPRLLSLPALLSFICPFMPLNGFHLVQLRSLEKCCEIAVGLRRSHVVKRLLLPFESVSCDSSKLTTVYCFNFIILDLLLSFKSSWVINITSQDQIVTPTAYCEGPSNQCNVSEELLWHLHTLCFVHAL